MQQNSNNHIEKTQKGQRSYLVLQEKKGGDLMRRRLEEGRGIWSLGSGVLLCCHCATKRAECRKLERNKTHRVAFPSSYADTHRLICIAGVSPSLLSNAFSEPRAARGTWIVQCKISLADSPQSQFTSFYLSSFTSTSHSQPDSSSPSPSFSRSGSSWSTNSSLI